MRRARQPHVLSQPAHGAEKPAILRAHLDKWGWQVHRYFGEVTAGSAGSELLAAAHRHPVFRLTVTG